MTSPFSAARPPVSPRAWVDRLVDRVPSELASELQSTPDIEGAIEALVRSARASWAEIHVERDAWADHLARHLVCGDVPGQLAQMRAADVHLALGCLARDPRALAEFDLRLREVAPRALSGVQSRASSLDDLPQDVRERLLVARDGATRPKLATYSGKGPIEGWLRVTIARSALSALRTRQAADPGSDDATSALLELAASDDPQLETLRRRYAPELTGAIQDAISALPEGDRVLLRLNMVDGLSIDDLAIVYGVHRATTARRLARVRHRIFADARARAVDRLNLQQTDFESLMEVMLSKLDITLRHLLCVANDAPR
jgi:RNA polymerase sigma-70 factor, ECF subfamily